MGQSLLAGVDDAIKAAQVRRVMEVKAVLDGAGAVTLKARVANFVMERKVAIMELEDFKGDPRAILDRHLDEIWETLTHEGARRCHGG
jgi:hypothetical protein